MHLWTDVQDLRTKCGMMLDKLEKEWSEFNLKLPPTIEEAHHIVDCLQVHCSCCHILCYGSVSARSLCVINK